MKWIEGEKNVHRATIGATLYITITETKRPERNVQGKYSYKFISGRFAIHEKEFSAMDMDTAKERAITEVRDYIERHMEQYRDWMDKLERADSEMDEKPETETYA